MKLNDVAIEFEVVARTITVGFITFFDTKKEYIPWFSWYIDEGHNWKLLTGFRIKTGEIETLWVLGLKLGELDFASGRGINCIGI